MLSATLRLGDRWTFVSGKGGVGKTTVAAALGVELAATAGPVLVVSVDPAHSLGDALGVELGPEPARIPGVPDLEALEVDAGVERARFDREHGAALEALIERGTYLDPEDVREITGQAVPGLDEIAALLRLRALARTRAGRVIIDTAPTGHTLRLLELPTLALRWLDALRAMERKQAAVAYGLARTYNEDSVTAFLREFEHDLERMRALFTDPAATRVLLVTTSEPVVLAETLRYQDRLRELNIGLAGVVVNRQRGTTPDAATGGTMVYVPLLSPEPSGVDGLKRFSAAGTVHPGAASASPARGGGLLTVNTAPFELPVDRELYLVGGKGGVGKTTTAAAIAVRLGRLGRRTLLLSVDPAGSLAEVLDMEIDSAPRGVPGLPRVVARQLDAAAGWSEFVNRYQDRAREIFSGLTPVGSAATLDQQVVERLLDLAPPGLDELVALLEVVDSTDDRGYDAVVLDSAPTGHLLRLLELPDIALGWCHALMRLLLKYRAVTGLGDLSEDLLRLTRRIRALRDRLRDDSATWFLAVALPEALSVSETRRLLEGVRRRGVRPGALLVNRVLVQGRLVPGTEALFARLAACDPSIPTVLGPSMRPAPVGSERLTAFIDTWLTTWIPGGGAR